MEEETTSDSHLEMAKETVLSHVKSLMVLHKVDLNLVVFKWELDLVYIRWQLKIYKGASEWKLTFMGTDVAEWARRPEIAGKYAAGILKIIERLKMA